MNDLITTPSPLPSVEEASLFEGERNLAELVKSHIKKDLEKVKSELTDARESLERAERAFKREIQEVDSYQRSLVAIKQRLEVEIDYTPVLNHLKGLASSGKYAKFSFSKNTLTGHTSRVTMKVRGEQYIMGMYEVVVDVVNVTVRIGGGRLIARNTCHPHVRDSKPCWGNVQAEVPKIILAGNFGLVFELAYDFLCSYNESSAYEAVTRWPKIAKKVAPPKKVVVVPEVIDSSPEGFLPIPEGRFSRLARQISIRAGGVTISTPGSVSISSSAGPDDVISSRADHDLIIAGILPNSLTLAQRTAMRTRLRVLDPTSDAYSRALSWYIGWIRRDRSAT